MLELEPMSATAVTVLPMPPGDQGTAFTIAHMRALIDQGKKDSEVREFAAETLHLYRVAAFDWLGEARAYFNRVLRCVRYTRDIRGKETLQTPRETLRLGIGDCDDLTILLCTLVESTGGRCRITTISQVAPDGSGEPPEFTHVYPEAFVAGRWIPLDAAKRHPVFGQGPRHWTRIEHWDTQSEDHGSDEMDGNVGLGAYIPRGRRTSRWGRLRGAPLPGVVPAYRPGQGVIFKGRYAVLGRGLAGRLMQDQSVLTDISQLLPAATTGTANIITASRANPINLVPFTGSPTATTGLTPAAAALIAEAGATNPLASLSSSWIWIALLGVGAIVLLKRNQ
jgi:Transglutaminase-like superfamily